MPVFHLFHLEISAREQLRGLQVRMGINGIGVEHDTTFLPAFPLA